MSSYGACADGDVSRLFSTQGSQIRASGFCKKRIRLKRYGGGRGFAGVVGTVCSISSERIYSFASGYGGSSVGRGNT